jgi:glycosyltransferase involved in cell wall biosynthesis
MGKVLLVAPSCDSTDVGEAWVAYQWADGLSKHHDVTVLTYRQHGRPSAIPQLPRARVVEWDQPRVLSRAARFNSLLKPWYPLFHRHCRSWIAAAQDRGERFDVGHQPVPVAMRYPSPLARSGIPFVLGPVGGGITSPPSFEDEDTAPWYLGLRRVDAWRLAHDPSLRHTYRSARVVLGIAPYVSDQLAPLGLADVRIMAETGVITLPPPVDRRGRSGPVRLLFVGRLIRTKGARDAIAALAHLSDLDVVLDVVGEGFDSEACHQLVAELGLGDRVVFHGRLPRDAVDAAYERADVFVFPSYREPGGNVQFEAMSHGLPLVVSDRGGPASVVTADRGLVVTPRDPRQYARDLAEAIRLLVTDPDRRLAMGAAARAYVEREGTWTRRIEQVEKIYSEISGHPR